MNSTETNPKEDKRTLYIPNSDLMLEYNTRVLNYLEEKSITFQIEKGQGDFIPYLRTRSGLFKGFDDIKRYAEALLQVRAEEGFDREPLGGRLRDSHNVMHFDNVSVQCASTAMVLANIQYQKELYKKSRRKKTKDK